MEHGKTFWMTGLSGSGKSTLAEKVKQEDKNIIVLDGDIIRKGLCSDLGFSKEDRIENNRRLIELCKLFNSNGLKVITAFISPYKSIRERAKAHIKDCKIVYIKSSILECQKRDPKGLYEKVLKGEIKNFTGITSAFDVPENADITIDTENNSIEHCTTRLMELIKC